MENEIPDKFFEQLKKLLAFQADAERRDSKAELENVTARITQLLMKYNITLDEAKSNIKEESKLGIEYVYYDFNSKESNWLQRLWFFIAKYNLCKVVIHGHIKKDQESFFLAGLKLNREVVKYIVPQLENRIRAMAKKAWKDYELVSLFLTKSEKRNAFLRGYYRGCVEGIIIRLESEQRQYVENINALIKRTEAELVEFMKDQIGNFNKSKATNLSGEHGFTKGIKDGSQMQIRQGLNESKIQRNLLK